MTAIVAEHTHGLLRSLLDHLWRSCHQFVDSSRLRRFVLLTPGRHPGRRVEPMPRPKVPPPGASPAPVPHNLTATAYPPLPPPPDPADRVSATYGARRGEANRIWRRGQSGVPAATMPLLGPCRLAADGCPGQPPVRGASRIDADRCPPQCARPCRSVSTFGAARARIRKVALGWRGGCAAVGGQITSRVCWKPGWCPIR